MPKTHPTGFLDLPLELRQMQVSGDWRRRRQFSAVCATDPHINEELETSVFKECGAHIVVTPRKEMGLPPAMEWSRFQRITIVIDHYQDHDRPERWAGMREIVSQLRYGNPEILPDISISFHQKNECFWAGDEKWTEEIPKRSTYRWHGSCDERNCTAGPYYTRYRDLFAEDLGDGDFEDGSDADGKYRGDSGDEGSGAYGEYWDDPYEDGCDDTWLRTTGDCYGNPIAIEILDYFLDLPMCKSAVVHTLRGLEDRRGCRPRHDPMERIFDEVYMEDLCWALQLWLKVECDGVELPAGTSKYGEPRLEQMAYQQRKGRYYCDGG